MADKPGVCCGTASQFSLLAEFEAHLLKYERENKTKFVVLNSDKLFGKADFSVTRKAVHWQLKAVPFDGTPFVVLGTKRFICHHGRDKHASTKRKREEKMAKHQNEEGEDFVFVETRHVTSKKMGCPAAIYAVHICRFPEYKIYEDTLSNRREKSAAVRQALKEDPTRVGIEQMFAAYFPHVMEHKNHPILGKDLVESWKRRGCAVQYRPSQERADGTIERLLLCLQTPWQRRLLLLYGQQMCMLDATYRTSRYSAPVFFLCVRTNVNYTVVGVFVTESEMKEDIREALEVFKKWNPDWKPSHFMADSREAEIRALEEVFTDAKVMLSDFYREKAWAVWTKNKDHGVKHEEDILKTLRVIADSGTVEEFAKIPLVLKQQSDWQTNEKLRTWFFHRWLCQAERWVNAFKREEFRVAVYANNGVERQTETLQHPYLKSYKNCSLSDTITVIVHDFLPRSYQRYVELNTKYSSGYQVYRQNVPPYLKDKPKIVAEHIMTRHQESLVFKEGQVTSAGEASFKVSGQTPSQQHTVSFGSESRMPSCTCGDWQKFLLPCKHFCAVFNLVPGCSWDSLCVTYRENPLFMLDEVCLGHSDSSVPLYAGGLIEPSSGSADLTSARAKARKRQRCGRLIKELADRVRHLQDESYMDGVIKTLKDLLEDVKKHTPPEALLNTTPVKRKSPKAAKNPSPPKKPRQKMPLSGRVEHPAEITVNQQTSIN